MPVNIRDPIRVPYRVPFRVHSVFLNDVLEKGPRALR